MFILGYRENAILDTNHATPVIARPKNQIQIRSRGIVIAKSTHINSFPNTYLP
jgi:hypothetical protein